MPIGLDKANELLLANLNLGPLDKRGVDIVLLRRKRFAVDLHCPTVDKAARFGNRLSRARVDEELREIHLAFIVRRQLCLERRSVLGKTMLFEFKVEIRLCRTRGIFVIVSGHDIASEGTLDLLLG